MLMQPRGKFKCEREREKGRERERDRETERQRQEFPVLLDRAACTEQIA